MSDFVKVTGGNFQPSTAKTGNDNLGSILRGRNMLLRGSDGSYYFECYGGETNLDEPIPMRQMTGTLSYTNGSRTVSGNSTFFKSELRFGQKILCGTQVFVVDNVLTNTSFTSQRAADATASNQIAYKMPLLFQIDNKRGTLIWGNAIKTDKGNFMAVGEGVFRLNGVELAGDTLRASRRLKIALYQPDTNNFRVEKIGYSRYPVNVKVKVVTGGVKNMSLGYYSFRFCWANFDTGFGFSNPGRVVKYDIYSELIEITGTLQRFEIDFTDAMAYKPTNADSIVVFRSQYAGQNENPLQAAEGPWYLASQVKISDLASGNKLYLDVLDGELDFEITFDNYRPPEADWLAFLRGDAVLVSCYGEKTTTNSDGASPGPSISAQKRSNRDAFPVDFSVPTSPPETIIGFVPGQDRIYLLTRISLPIAVPTTNNELEPVTTQPFWNTGFHSPFGLVLVNDFLYAFTTKGITRSIAIGDQGSEQFFAGSVADSTRQWNAGYVHAVHDRQNETVWFIHSAFARNENNYWYSVALPLYLNLQMFGPEVKISRSDRDMIVCGAANIGGKLQFLAGGRVAP